MLCTLRNESGEQDVGEAGEVEGLGRLGRSLEVFRQPTESSHPRKASLADPPPRHQDEAGLGLRKFHNVQRDPWLARHAKRIVLTSVCNH